MFYPIVHSALHPIRDPSPHPVIYLLSTQLLTQCPHPNCPSPPPLSPLEFRYGMREALAISAEEGLKEQWQRHEAMHHMLWDGLKSMGLKSFVDNDSERLITVNTIKVPVSNFAQRFCRRASHFAAEIHAEAASYPRVALCTCALGCQTAKDAHSNSLAALLPHAMLVTSLLCFQIFL